MFPYYAFVDGSAILDLDYVEIDQFRLVGVEVLLYSLKSDVLISHVCASLLSKEILGNFLVLFNYLFSKFFYFI